MYLALAAEFWSIDQRFLDAHGRSPVNQGRSKYHKLQYI